MNNTKQNDWVATVLLNPDKDYKNFKDAGLDASNTGMQSKDYYKDKKEVQDLFKTENGDFDDKKFSDFYDSSLRTYNTFVQNDIENNYLRNSLYSPLDILHDKSEGNTQTPLFLIQKVANPTLKSQGISGLYASGNSTLSMRQAAQTQKVIDSKTGKELNWTPDDDDKRGFFDFLFTEPLVEAKWDEDGFHADEQGRQIKHLKGDYKLNSNGSPYYETLGDREAANRNFLHWTDTLTKTGSALDKYNFLASDSLDKSVGGTMLKTISAIAPLFIPYVGQAYGLLSGSMYFGQALSVFGKTIVDALSNDEPNKKPGVWSVLNDIDSYARKFDHSISDEGQQGMFNFEQLGTMVSDVVGQLYQQRSIAKIPKLLGWDGAGARQAKEFVDSHAEDYLQKYGKTLKQAILDEDVASDYKKIIDNDLLKVLVNSQDNINKFAKNSSQLYMALTQTKDMYDTFKSSGYSDGTTAIGMVAALYGFNKLFNTSLGEVALSGLGLDDIQVTNKRITKSFIDSIEGTLKSVESNIDTVNSPTKAKWIKSIGDKFNAFYQKTIASNPEGSIANSLKEGLEEVSEEALQDAIYMGSNIIDNTFNTLGWTDKKGNYSFAQSNPLQRYFSSALGGAIGGAIFPQISKFEDMRDGIPNIEKEIPESLSLDIMQTIRNFGVNKSVDFVKDQIDKGKIGSTTLSLNVATNKTDDGKVYYEPASNREESQNNVLGNYLIKYLYSIDSIINSEGYGLKDSEVIDNALLKDERLKLLADSGIADTILNDFQKNLKGLVDSILEIQNNENPSQDVLNKQKQFKENLDNIVNGSRTGEFAEKMAFGLSRSLNGPFVAPDVYSYSKYVKGIDYSKLNDTEKGLLDIDYKNYSNSKELQKDLDTGYNIFKQLKSEAVPYFQKFRDSKLSEFKKQFYNIVDSLNASQNLYDVPEDKIKEYKEEVRNKRTDDEIIKELNLNLKDFKLTQDQKSHIVDAYLTSEIWNTDNSNGKNIGKAYLHDLDNRVSRMQENTKIGIDPLLNQRTVTQLSELYNSIRNLVSQTGYIDNDIKTLIDNTKNQYNTFDEDAFINHEINSIDNWIGFELSGSYEDGRIPNGTRFLGRTENATDLSDLYINVNGDNVEYNPEEHDLSGDENKYLFEHEEYGKFTLPEVIVKSMFGDIFRTKFSDPNSRTSIVGGILKDGNINFNNLNGNEFKNSSSEYNKIGQEVIEYLNAKKQAIDLISNIDDLSKNSVKNNPIYSMLANISTSLSGENVFKLLADEENSYSDLNNTADYVFSNTLTGEQLATANTAIQILSNSIIPYITKTDDILNLVDVSNQFKRNIGDKEDVPITQEEAITIQKELGRISEKISWLKALSDRNSLSKTVDSNKSMVRVNSILSLMLSNNTDVESLKTRFKSLTITDEDGNKTQFIDENILTPNEISDLYDLVNSGKTDFNSVKLANDLSLKVNSTLYNKFNNLSATQKEDLIMQISSGKLGDLNNRMTSKLDGKTLYEDINGLDLATYFLSILAVDPEYSQGILRQAIVNNDKHAPFFGQMTNALEMFALYKNPEVFNKFLEDTFITKPFISEDNYSTFVKNFIVSLGGAGTGKSTGVALNIYNMIKLDNPDSKIITSGSQPDVAQRLADTFGESESYDRINLFKKLLTSEGFEKFNTAINEIRNGKSTEDSPYFLNKLSTVFNPEFLTKEDVEIGNIPDVIFIDEFTHFTGIELQALESLNRFLDGKNLIIFGLGDDKQEGVLSPTKEELDLFGVFLQTPTLTTSIRANNVHKKDNLDKLSTFSTILNDKEQQRNVAGTAFNAGTLIRNFKNKTILKYYEKDEDGIITLNGDKYVDESDLSSTYLEKLIAGLSDNDKLTLITDNELSDFRKNVFHDLEVKYPNKLLVVDSHKVQGSEYKYTILDVNLGDFNNDINFNSSLKYFYTLISRSSDGSLIIKKPQNMIKLSERANTTGSSLLNQDDIIDYKKNMIDVLHKINIDNDDKENNENVQPNEEKTSQGNTPILDDKTEEQAVSTIKQKFEKERVALDFSENLEKSQEKPMVLGSFYNHYGFKINEDGHIETKPKELINEDLQGFDINDKSLNDIRNMKLFGYENVDLIQSLAYMKSLFLRSKEDIQQIVYDQLSQPEYYNKVMPFINQYFNGDNFIDKLEAFKSAILRGNFLFKLSKYQSGYDDSHNTENFYPLEQDSLFSTIVYQLDTPNGRLDITLGINSSIDNIIKNSQNSDLVKILKNKSELLSKLKTLGQIYYNIPNFNAKISNIEFGNKIYNDPKYADIQEVRESFNRGKTLEQTKFDHPEINFSQTVIDAATELDNNKARVVKGYPIVIMSSDLWKSDTSNLVSKYVEKIDKLFNQQNVNNSVTKGHLNFKGLTIKQFFSEWGRLENGNKGGKIYDSEEFGRLARPVEASRFMYSIIKLMNASESDIIAYNKYVDQFNSKLVLPQEQDWIKQKIAYDEQSDNKVNLSDLHDIQQGLKNIFNDIIESNPEVILGKLDKLKVIGKMNDASKHDIDSFSITNISKYRTSPLGISENTDFLRALKLTGTEVPIDSYTINTLINLSKEYPNITTLLDKLVDPTNDIYESDKIDKSIKNLPESKRRAIESFKYISEKLSDTPGISSNTVINLIKQGNFVGFTSSKSIIRRLLYNNLAKSGTKNWDFFSKAIDFGNLYKFGIWTNGIDSKLANDAIGGYYQSALPDTELYFDGPIRNSSYFIDYNDVDTTLEYNPLNIDNETRDINNDINNVSNTNIGIKVETQLELDKQNLNENIRNSVKNNITLQQSKVLDAIDEVFKENIPLIGNSEKDKLNSYKSELNFRIQTKLTNISRDLYKNEEGILMISPKYAFKDFQIKAYDEISLHSYINQNDILGKIIGMNGITLNPEDIKFNENDKTFGIRINSIDYIFNYDNNDVNFINSIQSSINPEDVETDNENTIKSFKNQVDEFIKTSMLPMKENISKIKLRLYNDNKMASELLSKLNLDELIPLIITDENANIQEYISSNVESDLKSISYATNILNKIKQDFNNNINGKTKC